MRLLETAKPREILLCESVDRLSHLSLEDWETLKATIKAKGLKLVVADLPTSHQMFDAKGVTGEVMRVINVMLIELKATMARLDQETRVERIKQGVEKSGLETSRERQGHWQVGQGEGNFSQASNHVYW